MILPFVRITLQLATLLYVLYNNTFANYGDETGSFAG